MSIDIVILSPKPPSELGMVEAEAAVLLDEWRERHGTSDDGAGRIDLGGVIPEPAAARAMVWRHEGGHAGDGSPELAAVLKRLATIRSAITLERVGDVETHPVLVSLLRLVIQRAGSGLVQTGDVLEPSEVTLARLAGKPDAPGFEDGTPIDDDAPLPPIDLAALTAALGRASAGRRRGSAPAERAPAPEPPRRGNAIDVPRLIVDRLVADGHIALDPKGRRDSLEKKLEAAMSADDERSPVRALIEVLLEHDAVAEVFGSDAELEASMRAALQPGAGR